MMGQKTTEEEIFRTIAEADAGNTGEISLKQFKHVVLENKKLQSQQSNDEDTLDVFVAMGGEKDGEGSIDAEKLIRIIKEDFEMTIDIEKLIKEIDEDGSGEIEFDELQKLLSGGSD